MYENIEAKRRARNSRYQRGYIEHILENLLLVPCALIMNPTARMLVDVCVR